MLTDFGIAIRKLRLDKGQRLLDLAEEMGKSSAFISAVETGRKPIPAGYVDQVARTMRLSDTEKMELRRAADRTQKEVKVDALQNNQKELIAAFARRMDEVPADVLEKLRTIVFKATEGDAPFQRKRRGLMVSPASIAALGRAAEMVRSHFCTDDEVAFPIMDILEFRLASVMPGFHLDVLSRAEMGVDEGRVLANDNAILLREDVYKNAWAKNGRARFTACHEFGHYLFHREVKFARMCESTTPIYNDAEWQADEFAGALLVSPRHAAKFSNPNAIAIACQITAHAATVISSKYKKRGLIG